MSSPVLIGLSGRSCSGKSTLAHRLAAIFNPDELVVVPVDAYYRDIRTISRSERAVWHFDLPEAIDRRLYEQQLLRLAQGETILRPIYLYPSHTRSERTISVAPARFILFEGLYAYYWLRARQLMQFRIFINLNEAACLERRRARDPIERGVSSDFVLKQWYSQVEPCFRRYVLPTREHSSLVLDGSLSLEEQSELVRTHLL